MLDRWIEAGSCNWSDAEDEIFRSSFASYYEKASAVFGPEGPQSLGDSLWERALLSIGNFLLPVKQNLSFLENGTRDATWKRLLRGSDKPNDPVEEKRMLVKSLLDRIDSSRVADSLQFAVDSYLQEKATPETDEWRRLFIECPKAIGICSKRQIRRMANGTIYLLSRQQMNSNHAELSTFHLKECVLAADAKLGKYNPFTLNYLMVNNEYSVPHAYLYWAEQKLCLNVFPSEGQFQIVVQPFQSKIPDNLRDILITKYGYGLNQQDSLSITLPGQQISDHLTDTISTIKSAIDGVPDEREAKASYVQ